MAVRCASAYNFASTDALAESVESDERVTERGLKPTSPKAEVAKNIVSSRLMQRAEVRAKPDSAPRVGRSRNNFAAAKIV